MKKLNLEQFNQLLAASTVKPRLKKELRFTTSVEHFSDEDWGKLELLSITDRSGNKGVLIIELDAHVYILPAEFKKGLTSSISGRAQPITCEFCVTWQSGTRAGNILFTNVKGNTNVGYLCCGDLLCSLHVRGLTNASKTSRAQLREDMTPEQRIDRLKIRLRSILKNLQVTPITLQ
jgi:hypothetical protein